MSQYVKLNNDPILCTVCEITSLLDEKQIVLEKEGLGFDYIFLRLPQVSGYQACLFLMSSWAWICYGMVTVGSVITQARPDHR